MPPLRVLSVVILVGMGAAVAAVGGSGESGEAGSQVHRGLIATGPSPSVTTAAASRILSAEGGSDPTDPARPISGRDFDVQAENQKPGTPGWRITRSRGTKDGLSGYTGAVSVLPGQSVPLSVSANGPVRVRALRIGWYDGVGARQVWQGTLRAQPEPGDPQTWPARGRVDTAGWPEGHYLLRLDQGEASRYLPLTVRSTDNRGRVVVLTSPLTWQAENTPAAPVTKAPAESPRISLDRPYGAGYGSGGFLHQDARIIQLAERSKQRIGFVTDLDVATDPALLGNAAAVLTGGDSQYWTASLRTAIRVAGEGGTNLAFFGAGTGARQIRVVDSGRALTISRSKPSASVRLTGLSPSCSPDPGARGPGPAASGDDWVISNANWWGYRGTGVRTDDVLPGLVSGRLDRAMTSAKDSPEPMQVLSYTRAACVEESALVKQTGVYLTRPSGAGVFVAGTGRWACALTGNCTDRPGASTSMDDTTRRVVTRITRNVIKTFAKSKAGERFPAQNSAAQYPALR